MMKALFKKPKAIAWAIILLLLAIIISQNAEDIAIDFLFWSVAEVPKLVLILSSMALGSIITLIILWERKK